MSDVRRLPGVAATAVATGALLVLGAAWPTFVPAAHNKGGISGGSRWHPTSHKGGSYASVAVTSPGQAAGSAAPRASSCIAAAALLATAAVAGSMRRNAGREAKGSSTASVVFLQPASTFAGGTIPAVQGLLRSEDDTSGGVTMRLRKTCFNLWFKRTNYKPRRQKELRNRAYNIHMMNKYKRSMKPVLRYLRGCDDGSVQPGSLQEIMTTLKEPLDHACMTIDYVCIQGVIHRNTAYRRKDKMCRWILRIAVAKGWMEEPEDPFKPACEVIGYEIPPCHMLREPRPWQLPGWKSPYMLRREFLKWVEKKKEAES